MGLGYAGLVLEIENEHCAICLRLRGDTVLGGENIRCVVLGRIIKKGTSTKLCVVFILNDHLYHGPSLVGNGIVLEAKITAIIISCGGGCGRTVHIAYKYILIGMRDCFDHKAAMVCSSGRHVVFDHDLVAG